MSIVKKELSIEINKIFNENELSNLKKSISKRHCLNDWNIGLIYLFNILQTAGILTTSIATSYNMQSLIWFGVGLNLIASLINVFEKTNHNISKKLLANIIAIKNGTFIDEIDIADTDKKQDDSKNYGSLEKQ